MALGAVGLALGGCGSFQNRMAGATLSDRECMARVMYFESNRSSEDGMLAVGTVVMNRLQSPRYPKTVCGVIGQESQFADGALSKPVGTHAWPRALRVADAVLGGKRHPGVGGALFFHTAGYSYPYRNMRYVTLAGGNIFYEKVNPAKGAPAWPSSSAFASRFKAGAEPIQVAQVDEEEIRPARAPRETTRLAAAPAGTPLPLHPRTVAGVNPSREAARPVVVAAVAKPATPVVRGRGIAVASTSAAAPLRLHPDPAAKAKVAAATPPAKPGTTAAAKPKSIVVAMLNGKAPRSIEEILAESRKR